MTLHQVTSRPGTEESATSSRWAPLACPACSGPLENKSMGDRPSLLCSREDVEYPILDGVPRLLTTIAAAAESKIGSQFLEWWGRAGPRYPRQRVRAHRAIVELAGNGDGRVGCDVGAGNTALARMLAEKSWNVFALDLYRPPVEGDDPYRIVRVVASMMQPPFRDASLDLVTFSSSLQYVPDPEAALAAWSRKLTPAGTILCALSPVHETTRGARRAEAHARKMIRGAAATEDLASVYQHFTRAQLISAFEGTGLEVEFLKPPFTRGFRLARVLKGLLVGPDLARFPILRARVPR